MRNKCGHRWLTVGLMVLAGIALAGLLVMALWNWLAPAIFGWKQIQFLQALGLLALTRILVGGFHGRHGFHSHWRHHMEERWSTMTEEEREKFRTGLRSCWLKGRSNESSSEE